MYQELVGRSHRLAALLCYTGALRVPLVALMLPELAFTLPVSGLLIAGAVWAYGRRRSLFLAHHGREGVKWAIQANVLLAAVTLAAKLIYFGWFFSGITAMNALWHMSATLFRWTGILVWLLTGVIMYRALQGETGDAFAVKNRQAGTMA